MTERLCVLTGDIVQSTRLEKHEFESLMRALVEAADSVRRWTSPPSPQLERFRGDGWQLALTDPRLALRATLVLRAALRMTDPGVDTRIGIGVGSAELASSLATSSGAAFEYSGMQLEKIKRPDRWSFQSEYAGAPLLDLARALFTACEGWSRRWTAKQAETVFHLLQPDEPEMASVARKLDVRPQTVQKHFAKAGGRALMQVVYLYEKSGS
jgi:hypothetical protein